MKKNIILMAVMLGSASLAANAGVEDIKNANNQINIQAISTKVDYAETGGLYGTTTGLADTENGNVKGYAITGSVMTDVWVGGNDYFAVNYTHNSGNTNYVGSLLGSGQGYGSYRSTSSAKFDQYSLTYGKGFEIGSQVMLTPYAEYGYRNWDRGLSDGTTETYSHYYLGVGAKAQYSPIERLVLGAKYFSGQTMDSKISSNDPDFPGATLGNSTITSYEVAADYAFTKNFHANLAYEQTKFSYGHSTPNASGYFEPNSSTKLKTVKLGVGYAW